MANKIYVLSDLHGHFQVFKRVLEAISFDESDFLYILGDCNDRGHESVEIYEYIMAHSNILLIMGNHEVLMKDMLKQRDWTSDAGILWALNGGMPTMMSIELHCQIYKIDLDEYCRKLIDFLDQCPTYIELQVNNRNYLLVHAGVDSNKSIIDQDEEDILWIREPFFYSKGYDNQTIIFGHTPTCLLHGNLSMDIWEDPTYHDKIGIDGGLASPEGQCNCLCLNDLSVTIIRKGLYE